MRMLALLLEIVVAGSPRAEAATFPPGFVQSEIAAGAVGNNRDGVFTRILTDFKGKILRINADGTIPPDNPFFASAAGPYRAIWALGFRNPFTFAIDPATGRMFVNDVGEDTYEEINDTVAGGTMDGRTSKVPVPVSGTRFTTTAAIRDAR